MGIEIFKKKKTIWNISNEIIHAHISSDMQGPQAAARGPQGRERGGIPGEGQQSVGEGASSPHTTYRNLGERRKIPSGVRGGAPAQTGP